MDRTNDSGNVGGHFSAGGGAVLPTVLGAEYMDMIQEELYFFLTENGISPDRTNTEQIHEAVSIMLEGAIDPYLCQGRLAPQSGVAIPITDQSGNTIIYFTPYKGNKIGVYGGSAWEMLDLTEISIAVPSTTDTAYDIFVYNNAGSLKLELLAWASTSVRATALVLEDGVLVKSGDATRRYLGSFITSDVSGEYEYTKNSCQLWNYYNRVARHLERVEDTDDWTYAIAAWRQANNNALNKVSVFIGVVEDISQFDVHCSIATQANQAVAVGIGINSTSSNSAQILSDMGINTTNNSLGQARAMFKGYLNLGKNEINWLEYTLNGTTPSIYGDGGLTVRQSGIVGEIKT